MGIPARDFWLMEVYELNQALEEYEEERRERLTMWRLSNYIAARPHFDPKQHIPTVEEWHPFPWDQEYKPQVEFIPYDEQIEFATRVGKPEWIPQFWYINSTKYQHLARKPQTDGTADIQHGNRGTEGTPVSTEAGAGENQKK